MQAALPLKMASESGVWPPNKASDLSARAAAAPSAEQSSSMTARWETVQCSAAQPSRSCSSRLTPREIDCRAAPFVLAAEQRIGAGRTRDFMDRTPDFVCGPGTSRTFALTPRARPGWTRGLHPFQDFAMLLALDEAEGDEASCSGRLQAPPSRGARSLLP